MILRQLREPLKLIGQFHIVHMRDRKVLDEETIYNTITNTGIAEVAGLINEATTGGFKWIAIGTSTGAATATNVGLSAELTGASFARHAATCSRVTTDTTNDTAQLVYTFTAAATAAVTEAGIFDASAAGIMLARQVFSPKNMEANDSLAVTYKIDVD